MPRIETTTEEDFTLPEGSLCLGPNGWIPELTQLLIETQGLPMSDALEIVWQEQQGILGAGELVFYRVDGPRGFVVFHPEEDDAG